MTQKIALITGASKGLGYTLAKFLDGYHVIITARGENKLRTAVRELSHVTAVAGDVSDPAHRQQLVEAVQKSGRLDLLINNASVLGPVPMPTLMNYPLEALADVFKVNVIAPVALVQVMLPFLQAANGLVVNLSSDAAVGGYAGWGGYGASKAALDLISLTLANELENVSVVSVDPGDMRTDMHQDAFFGEDISDRPLPEVTLPFWAWLLGQNHADINGKRYQAQAEVWEVAG
ncbi:MAG: SDR family oxidoreductase [Anaerolineae bacterium]|nr:SDR family oxidoreductase [Anaerolineae bacterium]